MIGYFLALYSHSPSDVYTPIYPMDRGPFYNSCTVRASQPSLNVLHIVTRVVVIIILLGGQQYIERIDSVENCWLSPSDTWSEAGESALGNFEAF